MTQATQTTQLGINMTPSSPSFIRDSRFYTTPLYNTLDRALSLARPHASQTTLDFTCLLWEMLPEHLSGPRSWLDEANNLHIDNRTQTEHRTLFVAHVDTVHRKEGPNAIIKTPTQWSAGTPGQCLGADDGAGIALLMLLIDANVPGYYIFTQGEECGGIGAKHLAEDHYELLSQFDRAIAFDRKGTDNVITHQGWSRCASDEFGLALADALNATDADGGLFFSPDDTGVYTDTAEFTAIIPECTNLSVGYNSNHGDKETLDMVFFEQLARAVLIVDWDALPTERDPSVVDEEEIGWTMTSSYASVWDKYTLKTTYAQTPYDDSFDDISDAEWLVEAVYDAKVGIFGPLIDMIAECAFPEDMTLAIRHIDRKRLTDEVLDAITDIAKDSNVDTALLYAFDVAYRE